MDLRARILDFLLAIGDYDNGGRHMASGAAWDLAIPAGIVDRSAGACGGGAPIILAETAAAQVTRERCSMAWVLGQYCMVPAVLVRTRVPAASSRVEK